MEYLKAIIELHLDAAEILGKIFSIKTQIDILENSQKQFKKTFNKTSPQFSQEILINYRKIKMLSRSYGKILKQINF